MLVRRVAVGELSALRALYAQLHPGDVAPPSDEVVRAVWAELMATSRYACFGAYVDEQLVATCALSVIPNLTRGCRAYGLLENVVTDAAHRRQGYARAVIAQALSHAWAAGCYKVMLLTSRQDEVTLRFYESVGFDRNAKQGFVAKPPA